MAIRTPIHALRDTLDAARLQEVQKLASAGGAAPPNSDEALQRVALLQIALIAVGEELAAHAVQAGRGGEQPLK
jgi:hypothetical protein